MSRTLLSLVLATPLVGACAPKPVAYDFDRPAQALLPIDSIGIDDGRPRYRRLFSERLTAHGGIEQPGTEMFLHRLADEAPLPAPVTAARLPVETTRFFFVPGYLGDMAPNGMMPYGPTIERLIADAGYRIEYVQVTGAGSSPQNAGMIDAALRGANLADDETVVLIGYSKGVTDSLHFLVGYPDTAARVDAVVSIAGVVNGTPLADLYPNVLPNAIAMLGGSSTGDFGGLDSLKRSIQMPWLAANPLPDHVRYFTLCAFTRQGNVSKIIKTGWEDLARLDPMNDSQVIFHDQVLPRSTLLGYANGDHWAVALPFIEMAPGMTNLVDKNEFPRDALFEALLLYVREALAN